MKKSIRKPHQVNPPDTVTNNPTFIFHTLYRELIADTETPVSLYLKLQSKNSCLLESVEGEEHLARFSYIGIAPFATFNASANGKFSLLIHDKKFARLRSVIKNLNSPKEALEKMLASIQNADEPKTLITSGAFGFIGYDAVHFIEKIPFSKKPNPIDLPDIMLSFYDTLIAIDNVKHKISSASIQYHSQSLPQKSVES
jgi:anthranilate synthase component I